MWVEKGMYWAWMSPKKPSPPHPPEPKVCIYVNVIWSQGNESRLCCGVWTGDQFAPMNRGEIAKLESWGCKIKWPEGLPC